MWISSDDIETLELTYRGSQLSPMTRPHTKKRIQAAITAGFPRLRGVQMGWGMLRWAAFLRKLKPGGTFFQIWVVWDRRGRRKAPTVSGQRWADIKGVGRPAEKWPAVQSGSVCHPQYPPACWDHSRAVTDPPHIVPEGPALVHSHSQHPGLPVKVASWHLLDRTGREGKGAVRSVCEPLTQWPRDLCSTSLALSFNSYRGPAVSSSEV